MQGEGTSLKTMEQKLVKSNPKSPTLSDDLIIEMILTRLPVKSVTQFKLVSKYWLSSISSINFAKSHLKFQSSLSDTKTFIYNEIFCSGNAYGSYISFDENNMMKEFVSLNVKYLKNDTKQGLTPHTTRVIGSSNGLLCVFNRDLLEFIIWNPVTKQYHNVGKPELDKCVSKSNVNGVGFGYIPSIDDYRIGFLVLSKEGVCHVHVYSLKLGEWEETACLVKGIDYNHLPINNCNYSVIIDDTIYWSPIASDHIIGLNLVSGQLMKVPLEGLITGYVDAKVFEVKGCLTLSRVKHIYGSDSKRVSDVFTLKMNGDENYSWEKSFSIEVQGLTIVHIFETGKCLVTRNSNQLMIYDPNVVRSRSLIEEYNGMALKDRHRRYFYHTYISDVWKYTESLISPSVLCARVVNEVDGDGDETGEVVEESG